MHWKEEYSVGIEDIDRQHRVLLDYFTLFENSVESGGNWSGLHFILIQLRDFARIHFAVEETLMHLFGYPGAADHTGEHQEFFRKMKQLEQESLHTDVTQGTLEYLHHWLVAHILGADQGYAQHIANGASPILTKIPGREVN